MKPYVYAVFLQVPCESIPPGQRFHLADKLITARGFNAHVRPACKKYARLQKSLGARTVRAYYSDDEIRVTRTVSCPSRTKWSILWPLSIKYIKVEGNNISISLLLYSKPAFFVIGQINMYLLQLFVILKTEAMFGSVGDWRVGCNDLIRESHGVSSHLTKNTAVSVLTWMPEPTIILIHSPTPPQSNSSLYAWVPYSQRNLLDVLIQDLIWVSAVVLMSLRPGQYIGCDIFWLWTRAGLGM